MTEKTQNQSDGLLTPEATERPTLTPDPTPNTTGKVPEGLDVAKKTRSLLSTTQGPARAVAEGLERLKNDVKGVATAPLNALSALVTQKGLDGKSEGVTGAAGTGMLAGADIAMMPVRVAHRGITKAGGIVGKTALKVGIVSSAAIGKGVTAYANTMKKGISKMATTPGMALRGMKASPSAARELVKKSIREVARTPFRVYDLKEGVADRFDKLYDRAAAWLKTPFHRPSWA
jgi:hypothetical protein